MVFGGVISKKAGRYGHYLEGYSSFGEEVERQVYEPPQGDKPDNRTGWRLLKVKGEEVATIFATDVKEGITISFDTRNETDKVETRKSIKELAKLCHIEAVITDDLDLIRSL